MRATPTLTPTPSRSSYDFDAGYLDSTEYKAFATLSLTCGLAVAAGVILFTLLWAWRMHVMERAAEAARGVLHKLAAPRAPAKHADRTPAATPRANATNPLHAASVKKSTEPLRAAAEERVAEQRTATEERIAVEKHAARTPPAAAPARSDDGHHSEVSGGERAGYFGADEGPAGCLTPSPHSEAEERREVVVGAEAQEEAARLRAQLAAALAENSELKRARATEALRQERRSADVFAATLQKVRDAKAAEEAAATAAHVRSQLAAAREEMDALRSATRAAAGEAITLRAALRGDGGGRSSRLTALQGPQGNAAAASLKMTDDSSANPRAVWAS